MPDLRADMRAAVAPQPILEGRTEDLRPADLRDLDASKLALRSSWSQQRHIAQIARTFGVGASSVSRLAKQDDETPVTT
jgi:hypothetical protein